MDVAEQTDLYVEYIVHVRENNEANDFYSSELSRLSKERLQAIDAAVAQHMTPLIQTLNWIRIAGFVGILGSLGTFCLTATMSAGQYDRSLIGTLSFGTIALITIPVGFISLIAVIWTSSRVSDLEARVREARTANPN